MKKRDFNLVGNEGTDNQELAKGIAFVKSRRAELNVVQMVESMRDQAIPNGVIINDAYCDRSMTRDYDREALNAFFATLKEGYFEVVSFKYENESYHIEIDDVAVFPQCYAAVVDKIPAMAKKTLIVDIGSWTIDIMPVINKSPDESKCVTIPKGLITCMRSINEQCVRQLNGEVDESEIQNIMRYGRSDIDDEYFAIIKAEIEDFVDKVYNSIREFGYNLKTTPIVFVGGGAVVMKNFGSHDAKNISYNLDVKANARGYEQLATMGLKSTEDVMEDADVAGLAMGWMSKGD